MPHKNAQTLLVTRRPREVGYFLSCRQEAAAN